MKRIYLLCFVGLIVNISCFSQLRQILVNDTSFVLVPIERIKKANEIFVKSEACDSILSKSEDMERLLNTTIKKQEEIIAQYDSLVSVKEVQLNLSTQVVTIQQTDIDKKTKTITWLKIGWISTSVVLILVAIIF